MPVEGIDVDIGGGTAGYYSDIARVAFLVGLDAARDLPLFRSRCLAAHKDEGHPGDKNTNRRTRAQR